ncbi:putative peptidyl-prolyl cis-trans isomerase Cbf2 [Clostridium pasteurianum DSM 525 = ATCC 6013]|uniref:PpiC-type peptidyl-prolyl cis-trans isomerase n=1 Tax=Clostridium pasteurianum DSM 525 = ATCC 6013 TaxID=1262449 RepID=A0A0H3J2S0_CLOPA|nr:peptidylprolyl isomerase [Clostridium pasteurianum]AJA46208.1 putative peptidyl-prolyl cis-trans isomerase Cbf2 [Clostridium pasteurianum DSM 525 = ATCC 6013]AJA50196.1 putative peptidyl-prolyl cis-trans isomerase Cbf2 [Clostridium pasteurianum DSM 525 = ATCC 6013]AOZ73664.1 peptidylprolyl isomerase [Clostridium pasteurianum DSM 525 = ATCC 6013]AOZ77461.1 peptidylprolyl isomerase [Clostridium pasteurianum]ELP57467.1 Peptidil-prolyl cis-trans isomerase [Clostridium pasteurianum DSM 525 = ATC
MENKVLASVNGKEITENDINQVILSFPQDKQYKLLTKAGKQRLLEQLVAVELIYNDAKDNGLENDDEYKIRLEAMKKDIMIEIATKRILCSDIPTVTEQEAKDYYEVNKDKFNTPATATAKHILLDTEEDAIKVSNEIKQGKPFEAAAKEYSTCPSKEEGGNLGSFPKGQMVEEFEEACFTQEIGIVGEPVKTKYGYHIIKVENRTEDIPKTFEEVKNRIIEGLTKERQNMRYTKYIEGLKSKYSVEMK